MILKSDVIVTESDDRDDDGNLLQDGSRNDSVGSNGSQQHNKREINKKVFQDGIRRIKIRI